MQGTTTNGDYLLGFRKGAFLAGAPVQPVILRYGKVGPSAHAQGRTPCAGVLVSGRPTDA